LAGDVVSHIALPGLGLRDVIRHQSAGRSRSRRCSSHNSEFWHLQKSATLTTDVAIGVIFTAALAIGTVLTRAMI